MTLNKLKIKKLKSIFGKNTGLPYYYFHINKSHGVSQKAVLLLSVAKKTATFSVHFSSRKGLIMFVLTFDFRCHVLYVLHTKHSGIYCLSWSVVTEEQADLFLHTFPCFPPCLRGAHCNGLGLKDPPWTRGRWISKPVPHPTPYGRVSCSIGEFLAFYLFKENRAQGC